MTDCMHFRKGLCLKASKLAEKNIPTYESTCEACLSGKAPQERILQGLILLDKANTSMVEIAALEKSANCCNSLSIPTEQGIEGLITGVVCMSKVTNKLCECYYQFTNGKWIPFHNECL